LRIPLYPFSYYVDRKGINEDIFKEALFLASKDFYDTLVSSVGAKSTQNTLYKYYTRACSRSTPFGLFASCAIGNIGSESRLVVSSSDNICRKTRLDMGYLHTFIESLLRKSRLLRERLMFYPNDTLYHLPGEYRYIEYYYEDGEQKHQIVNIEDNLYLRSLLKHGKEGLTISRYIEQLCLSGIDRQEAEEYINELIQAQVLRSELGVNVTGGDPLKRILTYIRENEPDNPVFMKLMDIRDELRILDKSVGVFSSYEKIASILDQIGIPYNANHIFQCDTVIKESDLSISKDITNQINEVVSLLNKITLPKRNPLLDAFLKSFTERYNEGEMVPLLKVLDPEIGCGYGDVHTVYSELAGNVVLPSSSDRLSQTVSVNLMEQIILKKIISAMTAGSSIVNLTKEDFKEFKENWDDLPATFSVVTRILNDENIYIELAGGSSAGNVIARFAHIDDRIRNLVQNIADKEEDIYSDCIVAEIVHLPNGRSGNILLRPILHKYEIPYLAHSQTGKEYQISLSDLYVYVIRGEVILYSRSLQKRIIPRLTSAHNYMYNSLPIYHFLGDLQFQGLRGGFSLNLDGIFGILDEIPQIRYKNCILSRHKWKIKSSLLKKWREGGEKGERLVEKISGWKAQNNMPRFVTLSEGDNELLIDWESMVSIEILLSYANKYPILYVEEFLFSDEKSIVKDSGNNGYCNEMIFFLYKDDLNEN